MTPSPSSQSGANSHDAFRAIADSSVHWESWFGVDGKLLWVSPAAERITGYSPEEILAMPDCFATLFAPEDLELVGRKHLDAMRGTGGDDLECRLLHRSGETRWLNVSWRTICDAEGQALGFRTSGADITAKKHSEELLRLSEERFRRFFELPLQGRCITAPNKGWVEVNEKLCSMLGYTREEILGMSWADLTHPDDLAADVAQFERVVAGEIDQYRMEKRYLRKDGTVIWTEISVGCVRKPDGRPEFFICVISDITSRKRSEDILRESEKRFRDMLENVHLVSATLDVHGTITFANEHLLKLTGWRREEILGRNWFDVFIPADSPVRTDPFLHIGQGRVPPQYENEILTREGKRRNIAWSNALLRGSHGEIEGIAGIGVDITARKVTDTELRRLRAAVEQTANSIVITNVRGLIEYVNPAFEKATGYSAAEVTGQSPRVLKSGEQGEEFYHQLWQTISAGKSWHGQFHNRRKDGTLFWESATISPVLDATGEVLSYIAVKQDITERKKMEADLIKALDLAEAANRAKGDFLAVMSHELRTPLNGVLGFADLLGETAMSKEQELYVQTIRESGAHLLAVVNDILDFSSIEKGRMKIGAAPITVADLIASACLAVQESAVHKGLDFRQTIDASVPERAMGDERRIRQILINLLGNAVKFTSRGSVILEVTAHPTGSRTELVFAVKDTGPGIAPETIARLFKPFSQADSSLTRPFEGTGLGLAISQRLAEAMDGAISVSSVVGEGSTFTFHLTVGIP
ncbi:MAG TPA: PAS domain S-box protein [Terrimicrobiaceae bacterium]|nr:PAS domain S-box protein [Terrimicrobiaceae bacterium]